MTRIRERTVLANFDTPDDARAAAQRIRDKNLGEARVDPLVERGQATGVGMNLHVNPFDADGTGILSSGNLGPLSATDYMFVTDSLARPESLTGRRPKIGSILLTVVTSEDQVPEVVSVIKEAGGKV